MNQLAVLLLPGMVAGAVRQLLEPPGAAEPST